MNPNKTPMQSQLKRNRWILITEWTLLTLVILGSLLGGTGVTPLSAQQVDRHYLYDYQMPPGEVAWRKTMARASSVGYFQPVDLVAPKGAAIEVFSQGAFQTANRDTHIPAMMVGHIYRLKLTGIPRHPGVELYPSVEILGRLFPPADQVNRFRLPIHFPPEDLEAAMEGHLVTRVIYLENPRAAIAEQRSIDDQQVFDVRIGEDPIRAAERFGRPMVIVRIGSRIPDQQELNGFGVGTPPLNWVQASPRQSQIGAADGTVQKASLQEPAAASMQLGDTGSSIDGECPIPGTLSNDCFAGSPYNGGYPTLPQSAVPVNAHPWPDELLLDGGDRNLGVVVSEDRDTWLIHGLDPEDTIGHFDTLDGRHFVDASNRVMIYAPRFAAMRAVDRLGNTQFATETLGLEDKTGTEMARHRDKTTTTLQQVQPIGARQTALARGLEDATRGVTADSVTQIRRASSNLASWEDLRLMETGQLDNREKGRLAIAMQRANAWDIDVAAQSTDGQIQLFVVDDIASAQAAVHIKTERNRPQLRIVKIASTHAALPGDEVEFTLRFDNVGDQPIGNVTIMDNLTGRLEYIEDSTECSVDATFVIKENNAGSSTLSWEIVEPLKVAEGGIIRFRCRVR